MTQSQRIEKKDGGEPRIADQGTSGNGHAGRWLLNYPRAIPVAIFLAIATITFLSTLAIETGARARETAQMHVHAQSVSAALELRGNSFSAYLRAGAALFASVDQVTPQSFDQFVSELRLNLDYKGAEGIGWVALVPREEEVAYLERMRALRDDFPAIRPGYGAEATRVAPVTYFAPDTALNSTALGYNMFFDPVRAAAMEEAKRIVSPVASGKIALAQKGDEGEASGFVIFMPVHVGDPATRDRDASLSGYVFAPFAAERFLNAAIDNVAPSELGVELFDQGNGGPTLIAARKTRGEPTRQVEQPVTIANREFLVRVQSDGPIVLAPLSMVTMLFGLAIASLLTVLARLLTTQAREDLAKLEFYEEQYSIRNSLARELNHRVRNTLANVLSILSLTRRRADNVDDFADSLEGRIRSLTATHDLLTRSEWETTPLRAVLEAELRHFLSGEGHQVAIDGPKVELAPNDALTFGLAIHELTTNAAKYGALSTSEGKVSISWALVDPGIAKLEWRESGGPAVSAERKRGFGTDLIEKIVAHELKQPVDLEFGTDGVHCTLSIPVRQRGEFHIREQGA